MTTRKRGRPRKNADQSETLRPEVSAQEQAAKQINAGLDSLALARDFALTIEAGNENPHDFEELAGEVRKAICEAGTQLERGLCGLGLLAEGAQSGWFVDNLETAVA